jgi:endoribonuclease Dicer
MRFLFEKFPDSTSDQLSWPRTRVVSCPALSAIAVQKLALHKVILLNNVELSIAISKYVPALSGSSADEIVNQSWKLDPPKAISDVFEAIMGAVLVDSAYNFEKAASVVEFVMGDVLAILSPSLRRDPITELTEWTARSGCMKRINFR